MKTSISDKLGNWIAHNKVLLWTCGAFVLCGNVFAAYFVSLERDIYFWDFMTYFQKYIILNKTFISDPLTTLETIFWSIREDRYNFLAAFILTPFSYLFGTSRISYVLAVLNVYAVPAMILMILFTQYVVQKQDKPVSHVPWIIGGLVLLSADFWNPILFGFLDIGGIIGTMFVLILYFKCDLLQHRKRDLFCMAAILAVLIIFRRWYAAWGIAFYAVVFCEQILRSFQGRAFDKNVFKKVVLRFIAMSAATAVIYCLAAPKYLEFVMKVNIIDYQTPYKESTNLLQFLLVICNSFGLPYLLLAFLGGIIAVCNEGTRRIALFLLSLSVVIFFVFTKLQDLDTHHRYLLLPQVIIFAGIFLNHFILNSGKLKAVALSSLAVILILNMNVAFNKHVQLAQSPYPSVFTDIRHPPRIRTDLVEIERMFKVLETISDKDDRIYVLAGSDVLNSHMMKSAKFYFNDYKNVSKRFLLTHYLDIKTGFPMPLLDANFVIVTDPVQQGKAIERHRVINVPAEMFSQGTGIARSFEKLPYEFKLKSDVKAYFYKKVRQINEADINLLSDQLKQHYPDREFVYKPGDQSWVRL